ncbi:hypothetical protein K9M41_02450 [Candidatus Gracilibacteria bacterium]|nr:hypothetical protein [Candidatus Gracilibacteria bacterium]
MSFEKPNWKKAQDNLNKHLESSKEVENVTKKALANLKESQENPYGKGWNEVQEAERRVNAEKGVEESLAKLNLGELSPDPASREFKDDKDIIRAEQFLMDLSVQAEKRGFGGLRRDTFPGEDFA